MRQDQAAGDRGRPSPGAVVPRRCSSLIGRRMRAATRRIPVADPAEAPAPQHHDADRGPAGSPRIPPNAATDAPRRTQPAPVSSRIRSGSARIATPPTTASAAIGSQRSSGIHAGIDRPDNDGGAKQRGREEQEVDPEQVADEERLPGDAEGGGQGQDADRDRAGHASSVPALGGRVVAGAVRRETAGWLRCVARRSCRHAATAHRPGPRPAACRAAAIKRGTGPRVGRPGPAPPRSRRALGGPRDAQPHPRPSTGPLDRRRCLPDDAGRRS